MSEYSLNITDDAIEVSTPDGLVLKATASPADLCEWLREQQLAGQAGRQKAREAFAARWREREQAALANIKRGPQPARRGAVPDLTLEDLGL